MKERKTIGRRSLIKGGSLVGASAAASLLAGKSASAWQGVAPEPETWDMETDVLVVGFGGAGSAAALAARVAGAEVLIIEKLGFPGGTTGISGGWIWIPNNPLMEQVGVEDSREDALTYVTRVAEGQADQEIIEAFVDRGPELVQFLLDNVDLVWTPRDPNQGWAADYHPEWEGGKLGGRSLSPEGSGPGLIRALVAACDANGIDYLLETPAKRLIARDGEVLGVLAESDGAEINIRARKAVVLTAAGFPWNEEMVKHYLRGPSIPTSTPGNTGDGILMGMAVGADLRNMNEEWGAPAYKIPGDRLGHILIAASIGRPGAIMVNRWGERFFNEAGPYDTVKRAFDYYDTSRTEYRNQPAYLIADAGYVERYTFLGVGLDDEVPEWVTTADSIRELAVLLGIDPYALETTVARFNWNAARGVDPDFMRGQSAYDRSWAGDPEAPCPNLCLSPLQRPPFYALEAWGGNIGTAGGLRVNANSQVLNPFAEIVPRLYAAGNNAGIGGPGAHYGGGGGTVGPAMVFGYIAGQHAAGLDGWE